MASSSDPDDPPEGRPPAATPGRKKDRRSQPSWAPWASWAGEVTISVIHGLNAHEGPAGWTVRGLMWLVGLARLYNNNR